MQEERFKKIQYDNKLIENKLEQTLKETSKLSVKQIQIGEQEVNLEKKQEKLVIDTCCRGKCSYGWGLRGHQHTRVEI